MALTEVYVNSAGSGGQTGIDAANAISWASMITAINGGSAAGNRYNVTGAISRTTTTDTISGAGTATSPVIIRGYSSSIGDLIAATRTNNNGLLVTTNFPALSYTSGRLSITGNYIIVETMSITSAATVGTVSLASGTTSTYLRACKVSSTGTNANSVGLAVSGGEAFNCDLSFAGASGGSAAATIANSGGRIVACHVTSTGSAVGVLISATTASLLESVINNCAGIGVNITAAASSAILNGCTVVGSGSDGIALPASTTGAIRITNCLITDNAGFGVNMQATTNSVYLAVNRYRDNTSGNIGNAGDWVTAANYNAVTSGNGTSDYTNAGSGDYSLLSTSPAVNAGQPYSRSIGALQRGQSASGGIIDTGFDGGFDG